MNLYAPHSLRTRLLWWLLGAILVTAVAQALIAYRMAHTEADAIFDYHMQQMAMTLRAALPVTADGTAMNEPRIGENSDFVVQVWNADGARVFQSAKRVALPERAAPGFSNLKVPGATYRVYSMQSPSQTIQIAQDRAARRAMASALALRMIAPIAAMAPLLMLVAWWVVTVSLAPVSRVRRQVATRQTDDLTEVSDAGLPDEIRPLVQALNVLSGRLRRAFDAQKSFIGDAAQELRSPLAALKRQAQGLRRATDVATREVAVGRLTAGIDRATRLVEQLLVLARQQASAVTGEKPQPLALCAIARLAVADSASAALARRINLALSQADEGEIYGHAQALRILLRNLVDNAIKYTPPGGRVDVEVCRVADRLVLTVDDSGPGIPEQDRERVLDRFYRVAGTEATGGGLGLAIVKSIADLHGTLLSLDHSLRLGGLRVAVSFPTSR